MTATAAKTKLPADSPIPRPLQAAIWALRPLEDRGEARYGEIFTLRIRRGKPCGKPWVLLTNPEHVQFKPERFLGGADAGASTWIAFGGGVRRCVAAAFANSRSGA